MRFAMLHGIVVLSLNKTTTVLYLWVFDFQKLFLKTKVSVLCFMAYNSLMKTILKSLWEK